MKHKFSPVFPSDLRDVKLAEYEGFRHSQAPGNITPHCETMPTNAVQPSNWVKKWTRTTDNTRLSVPPYCLTQFIMGTR